MYVQNMTLRCFYHLPSSDFFGFSRPGRNMLTFVQREYKNGCFQFIKIRCIKFTLTVFLRSNTPVALELRLGLHIRLFIRF